MSLRASQPPRPRDGLVRTISAAVEVVSRKTAPSFPEQPDEADQLELLNAALTALIRIFPDVQPEVFREMLGAFPEESRLQVVIETLLKHKAKWVKGRWRVQGGQPIPGSPKSVQSHANLDDGVPRKERFRTNLYKETVKVAFYQEFKGLSHSAIKAVLAEQNYSYVDTRIELLALAAKSWRYSVASFLSRRKPISSEESPFITWRTTPVGVREPVLIRTACEELNEEVETSIISPLRSKNNRSRDVEDHEMAERLNEEEATNAGATYDCECCFSSYSFERIVPCAAAEHYICHDCIRRSMSEALFGQAWAKSIEPQKATLRCIAIASGGECHSYLPRLYVQQALERASDSKSLWSKFEDRTARSNVSLAQTQPPASQCPSCMYAEVYDMPKTSTTVTLTSLSFISQSIVIILNHLRTLMIACLTLLLGLYARHTDENRKPRSSLAHPTQGEKFICRNPTCLRKSCLRCLAPWIDTHSCYQSSRQALETYVEAAISDAIKRTCPKCNLSFIKSSGCNKLVCVCGYSMCYVCRQDVGKEGYSHFCPHFRPEAGQTCRECERCDLYRTEDEDLVIKRAKEQAARDWRESMQGEQGIEELLKSLEEDEKNKAQGGHAKKLSWFMDP